MYTTWMALHHVYQMKKMFTTTVPTSDTATTMAIVSPALNDLTFSSRNFICSSWNVEEIKSKRWGQRKVRRRTNQRAVGGVGYEKGAVLTEGLIGVHESCFDLGIGQHPNQAQRDHL